MQNIQQTLCDPTSSNNCFDRAFTGEVCCFQLTSTFFFFFFLVFKDRVYLCSSGRKQSGTQWLSLLSTEELPSQQKDKCPHTDRRKPRMDSLSPNSLPAIMKAKYSSCPVYMQSVHGQCPQAQHPPGECGNYIME